jgi:hypothetical protein
MLRCCLFLLSANMLITVAKWIFVCRVHVPEGEVALTSVVARAGQAEEEEGGGDIRPAGSPKGLHSEAAVALQGDKGGSSSSARDKTRGTKLKQILRGKN